MKKMAKIIKIVDCAPKQVPILLDAVEWSIDRDFMPALKEKLQPELHGICDIWLDFSGFDNFRYTHEVLMDKIIRLLEELNILHRTSFINLPYPFYEFLQKVGSDNVELITRFEYR